MSNTVFVDGVQLGAQPSAGTIYSSDVRYGEGPASNLVSLTQHSKHASVTFGDNVFDWSASSGINAWLWAIWKMTPFTSLGNGRIRVTVHGLSGTSSQVKIMRAGQYDGTALPGLTLDTSSPGGLAFCTSRALTGSVGPFTYQEGYFAIVTGFSAHTVSAEITKVEWGSGSFVTLWTQPGIGTIRTSNMRLD